MAEDDTLERWRRAALETEGPTLEALGRAALSRGPAPETLTATLREAATAAGALGSLAAPDRAKAVALARAGLVAEKNELARWDALHLVAELGLAELAPDVRSILKSPATSSPPVRGRAAEAYAVVAAEKDAKIALEPARVGDPDWSVRRLAGEALRAVESKRVTRGDLFGRFRALLRCGRIRIDGGSATLPLASVVDAGVALPAAYRLFLVTACAGGKVVLAADDPRGQLQDTTSLTLSPPATLRSELESRAPSAEECKRVTEHVWTRYVDGGRGKAGFDEAWALRLLAERYDGGLVDADLWNYGVLLFEHAFQDEAKRSERLLRCRAVLSTYRDLAPEPWDVVDDRLAEVTDTIEKERLALPVNAMFVQLGAWDGHALAIDLNRPGVFLRDPAAKASAAPRVLAPTLAIFLNDLLGHGPKTSRAGGGESEPKGALVLLDEAEQHLAGARHKQAGRLFSDALDQDTSEASLARAAALLTRTELTPLLAGQLLVTVAMAGDDRSSDVVRSLLQALAPERARDVIEALGPYDDPGTEYARIVDAAVALRAKSHVEARDAAKKLRQGRAPRTGRTARNPFIK